MKVYVCEGQDPEMTQFIKAHIGDNSNRTFKTGENSIIDHGDEKICAGSLEERFRAVNITAEIQRFKPNVVIVPVKLSEPIENSKITGWMDELARAGVANDRVILLGVVSNVAPRPDTSEKLSEMGEMMEVRVVPVKLNSTTSINMAFDEAKRITEGSVQAQQPQPAAPPPKPAVQTRVAPPPKPVAQKASEIEPTQAKQDNSASLTGRIKSMLSVSRSRKDATEVKDNVVVTIYSDAGKMDAKSIISKTLFDSAAEKRSEVKPTKGTNETTVTVRESKDNSQIQLSAAISRDPAKQTAASEQMANISAKLSNAVPGGATVKVVNDTHNDSVRAGLESKKLNVEPSSARLKY